MPAARFLLLPLFVLLASGLRAQGVYEKHLPCERGLVPRLAVSDLLSDSSVALSWRLVPETRFYRVRVARGSSLLVDTFLTGASFVPGPLPLGQELSFRVQAQCENGDLSAWSRADTFAFPAPDFGCGDLLVDARDGQIYRTVAIGDQCWMAENLNYALPDESFGFSTGEGCNAPAKAGRFYSWTTAKGIDSSYTELYYPFEGEQGVCPVGWHVPTDSDYLELINHPSIDFESIRIGGGSGFELHLGGYMNTLGNFTQVEKVAFLITSSSPAGSPGRMDVVAVDGLFAFSVDLGVIVKDCRGTVRCLKDE